MRVAFSTGFTLWTPHYETELELIQRHLDGGDEVIQLHCTGEPFACEANPYHDPGKCYRCIGIRRAGLETLSARIRSHSFLRLDAAAAREIRSLPKSFESIDALKAYHVDNFDIGYAVLSSVVSACREPYPDLATAGWLTRQFMTSALAVYRSLQRFLQSEHVDRVYVFNGRYAQSRAVLRACQSRGIDCFIHERGHTLRHYSLYENALPHDLAYIERCIRNAWQDEGDVEKRERTGSQFYVDRAAGVMHSWFSFVADQEQGKLPSGWDPNTTNIVVFNSSEDEFVSIGDEWKNPIYQSQHEAMCLLAEALRGSNARLYVRCHPNLKDVDNAQTRLLREFTSPVVTVIPPESKISTYALLRNASKVVSFGSTVGIEAVYWGIPSILVGNCYYRNLGGTYNPRTHDEVVDLLRTELTPLDREAAMMYGYYMNTFGKAFEYYATTGVRTGTFKGVNLDAKPSRIETLLTACSGRLEKLFLARSQWLLMRHLRLTR